MDTNSETDKTISLYNDLDSHDSMLSDVVSSVLMEQPDLIDSTHVINNSAYPYVLTQCDSSFVTDNVDEHFIEHCDESSANEPMVEQCKQPLMDDKLDEPYTAVEIDDDIIEIIVEEPPVEKPLVGNSMEPDNNLSDSKNYHWMVSDVWIENEMRHARELDEIRIRKVETGVNMMMTSLFAVCGGILLNSLQFI